MKQLVTQALLISLLIFNSSSAFSGQKQASLKFLAAHSSILFLGHIAEYAEQLDHTIAGSEERCFAQGIQTDYQWRTLSYFLQNHLQGELFSADHCQHFSGQRFYADSSLSERLEFIHSENNKHKAHGFVETCQHCYEGGKHLIHSNIQMRTPQLSFRLNMDITEEKGRPQQSRWLIQGNYSMQHQSKKQCSFEVEGIETIQALEFKGNALSLWNNDKSLPAEFLKGELNMKLSGHDTVHIRYDNNKIWVDGFLLELLDIQQVKQACFESKSL